MYSIIHALSLVCFIHVAYLHWDKFYLVGWLIKLLKLTIITKHRVEVGPQDFEGTRRPANPPLPTPPLSQGRPAVDDQI
jgi:hypothetical protein